MLKQRIETLYQDLIIFLCFSLGKSLPTSCRYRYI